MSLLLLLLLLFECKAHGYMGNGVFPGKESVEAELDGGRGVEGFQGCLVVDMC